MRAQLDVTSERLSGFSEVSVNPAHAEHVLRELSGHEDKACVRTRIRSLHHLLCLLLVQNIRKLKLPTLLTSLSSVYMYLCCLLKDAVDLALSLVSEGDRLIENSHYAEDSIRPKCMELRGVCEEITSTLRSKKSFLLRAMELHHSLEKVRA